MNCRFQVPGNRLQVATGPRESSCAGLQTHARPTSHSAPALRRMCRGVFLCALCAFAVLAALPAASAWAQERDFLTGMEADKIRDAETPNARIKLFLDFAADRMKKFHYERSRSSQDRRRAARLAALLSAYAGCVDDAGELIDLGRLKQQDIHEGIEDMEKRGTDFLADLEKIGANQSASAPFREELLDALDATREALALAAKAKEEIAPPPVRRNP